MRFKGFVPSVPPFFCEMEKEEKRILTGSGSNLTSQTPEVLLQEVVKHILEDFSIWSEKHISLLYSTGFSMNAKTLICPVMEKEASQKTKVAARI